MPTQVLTQLRVLRESIADALRKDPRYLTLTALDKTIAEIDGVLRQSGVATAPAQPPEPLQFDPSGTPAVFQADTPTSPARGEAERYRQDIAAEPVAQHAQASSSAVEASPTHGSDIAADEPKEDELQAHTAPVEAQSHPAFHDLPAPEVESPAPIRIATVEPEVTHAAREEPEIDRPEVALPFVAEPVAETDRPGIAHDETPVHGATTLHGETTLHDATTLHDDASDPLHPGVAPGHPHEEPMHVEAAESREPVDPLMNYHVTDEDESVALALGASSGEDQFPDFEGLHDAQTHDGASALEDHAQEPSGYVPMQAKLGAAIYQPAMSVKFGKLPNKVDLRPLMTPVEDRAAGNAGVAEAVAGAYEYWIRKSSKQERPISRTFLYYNARWRADAAERDEGCTIQFALESLMRFGACGDAAWPEEHDLLLARPGGDAYRDASPYKIHDMAHVPLRIDAWKQALAEGKPIMFGCATFDGFDACASHGGIVPLPSPHAVAEETPHLRALCAVGYSESERVFIVRTGEGAGFGDQGYCYMPFDYLMSEVLNDGDCWVFIPKVPSQPPREVWSDDTTPVTNGGAGISFSIDAHLAAEYEAIGRDLFAGARRPYIVEVPEGFARYVALAGRSAWDEMEQHDAGLLLAAATLEGGMAALASAFPGASATNKRQNDVGLDQPSDAFQAKRQKA